MWTQVAHTTLDSAGATLNTNHLTVIITGLTISSLVDYWIVIDPKSTKCEIRKVSADSSGYLTLTKVLTFDHAADTLVYIQTSPIWDIELFGADPNHDASTNSTGINNATYDCDLNGGGKVWIPKGEFLINNKPDTSVLQVKHGVYTGCIDISAISNVKFVGDGMGISILKMEDGYYGEYDLHFFYGVLMSYSDSPYPDDHPCDNIEWHDITLNGNRYNIESSEQSHCININGKASLSGTTHVYTYSNNCLISNVEFIDAISDGIKTGVFNNMLVNNCRFINCGRSGITVQTADKNMVIDSNYFENTNDTDIDFEPTGNEYSTSPNKVIISNNIIIKKSCNYLAISLGGFILSPEDERIIISGNTIRGGGISVYRCRNLEVTDNEIFTGNGRSAFQSISLLENLVFCNNIITNNTVRLDTITIGYEIEQYTNNSGDKVTVYLQANKIDISGNTIINGGLNLNCVRNLNITDNKLIQNGKKTSVSIRISLQEDLQKFDIPDFGNLVITGNDISHAGYAGIWLSSNKTTHQDFYKNICIDNNCIEGQLLENGVYLQQSNSVQFWEKALIGTSNTIISQQTDAQAISVFTDYMTGTNIHEEDWITAQIPTSTVLDAPQGALAVYNGIAGDNKYQKNSMKNASFDNGWMLVSELDRQVVLYDTFNGAASSSINTRNPNTYPNVNVFGNTWATSPSSSSVIMVINNGFHETRANGSTASKYAYINTKEEGEIKAIFRIDLTASITLPISAGIIFRLNGSTASCWKFYFKYTALGAYEIWLENPGSGTVSNLALVELDESMLFNLKVMMQGNFISVYYNDLLLWTVYDSYNNSNASNGILFDVNATSNQVFFCRSFKHLIH